MDNTISKETPVNEIAVAMSEQIASKVDQVRELKAVIESKRESNGIVDDENEIAALRGELLELTREYKEVTGENWEDEAGFARYVSPGESHKYEVKTVDEVLSALLALSAQLSELADDGEYVLDLKDQEDKVVQTLTVKYLLEEAVEPDRSLFSVMLLSIQDHYQRKMQEVNLRVNALDVELKKVAAARSVKPTKERVNIR